MEHGFRVATEGQTREQLGGKFWPGYFRAAGNLHGWSDGDPFLVNYVGHPIQGAVSGFIWIQNDPRYRNAEFGDGRRYWKSRLRAAAFSFAYSEQFEIGPLSEASIGRVQGIYPQQGLVDHVITPVVGTGWLVAEDAIDRHVIRKLEGRYQSPWLRGALRTGLNPARTMANVLRMKVPWYRDTREGILSYDAAMAAASRKKKEAAEHYETIPVFELSVPAQVGGIDGRGRSCAGGGASFGVQIRNSWQLVADVSGCKMQGLPANWSGDQLAYALGPKWTPLAGRRLSPYVQVLVGGKKVTQEQAFPELKAALGPALTQAEGWRKHAAYTKEYEASGFAMSVGGGVDVGITRALALRLASVDYSRAWLGDVQLRDFENTVSFRTGVVLKIGTW